MPLHKIQILPGINQQQTQTQNATSYWACNLIRFRDGMVEKLGGWQKFFTDSLAGIARALAAWEDLHNNNNLAIGTDGGLQVYENGVLYNTTLAVQVNQDAVANGIGLGSMGVLLGATSVNVFDTEYTPVLASTVTFPMTSIIGGTYYVGGSTVIVTSSSSPTWGFTLPNPSTVTSPAGAYVPYFTVSTLGTARVRFDVSANNWVPVVGQPFHVEFDALFAFSPLLTVPAGTYTIKTVNATSPPDFTITFVPNPLLEPIFTAHTGYERSTSTPTFPVVYGQQSYPSNATNWFLDNLGQDLLFCYTNGPLSSWTPPVSTPPVFTSLVLTAPAVNAGMLVAMPQAQVILWGTESVIGDTGSVDPLLIRFSDVGTYSDWVASATNQAGSYRLSRGSKIVGGIQNALTTLIWTDTDVWVMQYVGAPFVYSFNILSQNCGLISAKARAILGGTCFWMGQQQFYAIGSGGAQSIYCPVWDVIFNDLDTDNLDKINAGSNSAFNEIFFFYPSISGGTGEPDKYVKLRKNEDGSLSWDYGSLARTTWLDSSVFGAPLAGDVSSHIQQHETGYDADGEAMEGVFIETGYVDIAEGDQIMSATEVIPDLKWFGDVPGAIMATLKGVMYPQGPVAKKGPFGMDMANRHIRPRFRTRSLALRWDWLPRKGFNARIGSTRVRTSPSGRRP